jgi:hypothetical protein
MGNKHTSPRAQQCVIPVKDERTDLNKELPSIPWGGLSYVTGSRDASVSVHFPPGKEYFSAYEKVLMTVPIENGSDLMRRRHELVDLERRIQEGEGVTYPPVTSCDPDAVRVLQDACTAYGIERKEQQPSTAAQ